MVTEREIGELMTDNDEVLHILTQYCDELYNYQRHPDFPIFQGGQHYAEEKTRPSIRKDDIKLAVRRLKPGR